MDPTTPPLSEKDRANYPEGHALLDTPLQWDPSGLSLHVVFALKLQVWSMSVNAMIDKISETPSPPIARVAEALRIDCFISAIAPAHAIGTAGISHRF